MNSLPFNAKENNILQYIQDSLHTNISIDQNLFDDENAKNNPIGLNFNTVFSLTKPSGIVSIQFTVGKVKNIQSIIWITTVRSLDDNAPKTIKGIENWLEEAHAVSDKWFFTLARGELMNKFEGI